MQVILKPTVACNGTCRYCAALPSEGGGWTMPAERLATLFDAFGAWFREDETRHLSFLWHGGEPMLRGVAFYENAREEQDRVFGAANPRVTNRMQSNLALLDEDWLAFLPTFVKGIGTSYDPIPGVRGLRNGDDLAARWLPAVDALRDAGVSVGVVYVIHRGSLPHAKAITRFFSNLDPRGRVRFNPLYREGLAATGQADDLAIEPTEYGRFLVEVAEAWWDDGCRTSVLPIREWYDTWRGEGRGLSCDSRGGCQETHLGVMPTGDVYGCGRSGDARDEHDRLGNLYEDTLADILAHPVRTELAGRGRALRETVCRGCPYWSVCHGGCPMMARIYHGDPLREDWFCHGRKQVYAFLEERLGPSRAGARAKA